MPQEQSLVKFLGIESRQPLVTDVNGEALAIADGVREMVACFWLNRTVRGIPPAEAVDLADEQGTTLF